MLESLLDPWRWERSFQDFPDYLAGFGMTLKVTVVGWLIAMARLFIRYMYSFFRIHLLLSSSSSFT